MKKFVFPSLILLIILSCLTACNFYTNASGTLAGNAECTPKAEEMMMALAEGRAADAKALMHPDVSGESDAAIAQLTSFLSGRKVATAKVENVSINNSTGTSGKIRQEQVVYHVTLDDGEVIDLNVNYRSDNNGAGFASFQLVLGVV